MPKPMSEDDYRVSRLFRALGNPINFSIVKTLSKGKKRPKDIAKNLGRKISTISTRLRELKISDVVRYETFGEYKKGRVTVYWLKDKKILDLIKEANQFVRKMREKRW